MTWRRRAPVGKFDVKTSAVSPKDLAPRHSISICFAGFLTSMSYTQHTLAAHLQHDKYPQAAVHRADSLQNHCANSKA